RIVDPEPYLEEDRLGLCLWYVTEIAARAAYYRYLFHDQPNVHIHWIDLKTLKKPTGVASLLLALGQRVEAKSVRLPPGFGGAVPAEPTVAPEISRLLQRFPFKVRQRAKSFLKAGGRLGLTSISGRGSSGQG
ncbi:MAG: hypothetical protein MJA83_01920, partial [Gammaproteobacteria bacterium]|nr:hypothetical protein [Gammaproteobacteria bacterium]